MSDNVARLWAIKNDTRHKFLMAAFKRQRDFKHPTFTIK